jgi:hypothetical protein
MMRDGRRSRQLAQQLKPFWPECGSDHRYPGGVAARPVKAGAKAERDRITARREDTGMVEIAAFKARIWTLPSRQPAGAVHERGGKSTEFQMHGRRISASLTFAFSR